MPSSVFRPRRTLIRQGLVTAGALLGMPLLAGLSGCGRPTSGESTTGSAPAGSFKSLDITGANYGRHLDLPDFDGKIRHLSDFPGQLVVVFFGYTQCPDVCPTTLANLAETVQLMGADGAKVKGVFVTVDPERDQPELLKAYVTQFNPNWTALRGTPEQIAEATKEFKVFYRKVPGQTESSYTVDHTAASYVFDVRGRLRLYVRHATPAAELAADLKQLLAEPA